MIKLANYIFKEGDVFYFDLENYNAEALLETDIEYNDGDTIRWRWEDKAYVGTLREADKDSGILVLEQVIAVG